MPCPLQVSLHFSTVSLHAQPEVGCGAITNPTDEAEELQADTFPFYLAEHQWMLDVPWPPVLSAALQRPSRRGAAG